MSCGRSATCNARVRRCPVSGGRPCWSGPPIGSRAVRRPRPGRRWRAGVGRRMAGRCGSNRPPPHFTSEAILAQEEHILTWAHRRPSRRPAPVDDRRPRPGWTCCRPTPPPRWPARTGWWWWSAGRRRQDHDAARAVDDLTPAPAGVRRRPDGQGGPGPRTRRHGIAADTVAKLLHEWARTDRPPTRGTGCRGGATVIVDEAGMIGTARLYRLVGLADAARWRLVLVGDPRQLQAVGRGGMFNELAPPAAHSWTGSTGSTNRGRQPRPSSCDTATRPRSTPTKPTAGSSPAPLDEHLDRIAEDWLGSTPRRADGRDHRRHQRPRRRHQPRHPARPPRPRRPRPDRPAPIAGGEHAHVGDVVATRRNDRQLHTTLGEPVRNRDLWTVTAIHPDGELTVTHNGGHGTVTLPPTTPASMSGSATPRPSTATKADTVDVGIDLVTPATTHRGLYVGVTRGRDENLLLVVTDTPTSPKPATSSTACSPATAPTSPPSPNADTSPKARPTEPTREQARVVPPWVPTSGPKLEQRRADRHRRTHRRAGARRSGRRARRAATGARRRGCGVAALPKRIDANREKSWRTVLRPAMWKANQPVATPGSGTATAPPVEQRCHRARRGPQARIAAIHADGAQSRIHSTLEAEARRLTEIASPQPTRPRPARPDQLQPSTTRAEALDTWTTWAADGPSRWPTPRCRQRPHDAARHAPPLPTACGRDRPNTVARTSRTRHNAVAAARTTDPRPPQSRSRTRRTRPQHRPMRVSAASNSPAAGVGRPKHCARRRTHDSRGTG